MDDETNVETWSPWFLNHIDELVASADCMACLLIRRAESKAQMLEASVACNQGKTIVEAWAKEAREAHDLAVSADHSCGLAAGVHRR